MRKALVIVGLLGLAVLILCAIMLRNANAPPVQRNLTVELDGLPPRTRPLKVVLLADFHVGDFGNTPQRFRETARRVTALNPDLILLAGDFISQRIPGGHPIRSSVAPLAEMKARLGIFAVLGNHDYGYRYVLARPFREHGVRLLNNQAARVGPLAVVGIGDAASRRDRLPVALRWLDRVGGVPIALSHSPDIVPALPSPIRLALAGHTHCGQVVLPIMGPIFTSSRFGGRYACGVVREGGRTTIVTSGLGVSRLPFRLNAPPDFWVITLVPRPSGGGEDPRFHGRARDRPASSRARA